MNLLWFLLLFTVRSPIMSWMIVANCCCWHGFRTTIIRTLQFSLHSINYSLFIADDDSLYMSRVGSSLSKTESCLLLSMTEFLFPLSMTELYPLLSMTEFLFLLSMTELYPPLSMTEFLFPLSMTELYPLLSMTELYPLLSILTEFYPYAILIQNILPAHGTLVCSNSYDKITSAVTSLNLFRTCLYCIHVPWDF